MPVAGPHLHMSRSISSEYQRRLTCGKTHTGRVDRLELRGLSVHDLDRLGGVRLDASELPHL